jgi:hypothetical protein
VEIHTKQTLINKYGDTNLFDGDLPLYDTYFNEELAIGLSEWIDGMSMDDLWKNRMYDTVECDNFSITRIK